MQRLVDGAGGPQLQRTDSVHGSNRPNEGFLQYYYDGGVKGKNSQEAEGV